MLAERQTEWIISNNLKNKGWHIDSDDPLKNVYFQIPKLEEQTKKLKGKRPDYILYQTGTDKPIAIIEAKKGGVDLEPALEQATEYAQALDAPLVFAMNGSYCETRFVPNGKELILNGEEVRELLREKEALKFIEENTNEVYTIPKQIVVSRDGLISTFKNLNNVLRSEGLRAGLERFSEFANILFLKLLSEGNEKSWWNSIKSQANEDIIGYTNNHVIKQVQDKYGGDVFTQLSIRKPETLRHIIDAIDPLVLSTIDTDVKGEAFEYFLEKTTSTENDLGEYFTPRNVVKTIINLVAPKFKETIYDPFCGTGGFLIEAFNYIKENNIIENKEDLEKLKHHTLYGGELTTTARIAKMNMILHGDGHSGIKQIDSLENPDYINSISNKPMKFDVIVTNVPFSQKITRERLKNGEMVKENYISPLYYNGIAKNDGDSVCILHCLRALKEGGRMALVVPEGFLFRKHTANVRKFLLSKANLQCIISLPRGTFLPYTGAKTNILYFNNAHKPTSQKSFWFFEAKNIGVTLDNYKRKIKGMNDLHKIEASDLKKVEKNPELKDNMLQTGFEVVDLEKVKKNNYNLIGNFYREVKQVSKYQIVKLKEIVLDIKDGGTPPRKKQDSAKYFGGNINWCVVRDIKPEIYKTSETLTELGLKNCSAKIWDAETIIISLGATIGNVGIAKNPTATKQGLSGIVVNRTQILPKYLFYILLACKGKIQAMATGATIKEVRPTALINNLNIPLPPIEEQQKIVDELDGYQKGIDGANQVIDSLKPKIKVDKDWEVKKIGDVCSLVQRGKSPIYGKSSVQVIKSGQAKGFFHFDFTEKYYVSENFKLDHRKLEIGDILINSTGVGTARRVTFFDKQGSFVVDSHITILRPKVDIICQKYLLYYLSCIYGSKAIESMARGSSGKIELDLNTIKNVSIALPPLHIQQEIVERLEAERKIIEFQKSIITTFEKKREDSLDDLWQSERKNKVSDNQNESVANQLAFESLINKTSKPSQ